MILLVLLFIFHIRCKYIQKREWEIKNKDLESNFIYCSSFRWSVLHQCDVDGISSVRTARFHPLARCCLVVSRQLQDPMCFQILWVQEGIALSSWVWRWAQTFTGDEVATVADLVVPDCWIWGLLRLATFVLQLFHSLYATERCALLGYVVER